MKNTKGEWEVKESKGRTTVFSSYQQICDVNVPSKGQPEREANAKLIAEAGTVANETGKTPKQLAEENHEMLKALQEFLRVTHGRGVVGHQVLAHSLAKRAIKKATE